MRAIITGIMILVAMAQTATAQYIMSGRIEFERKVNVHARMKDYGDDNNSWYERMKSQTPKYNITYFDMVFDRNRSLYKPGREVENQSKGWGGGDPASDNVVYTDLVNKRVKAIKQVYEQRFVVQDSMRRIDWRLKDELRTIAGYKCRKAVGVICDSVYVVVFYTDEILANTGPEMFGNLPGMVLELAIPRLHTTWVATKVQLGTVKDEDFEMSNKGRKVVTSRELYEAIQAGLKDWGKWAARNIWLTTL
jgi:GLPGLI family protein